MEDDKMTKEVSTAVATILRHQVRQVLMSENALGLNRQHVRDEARAVVEEVVGKSLREMLDSGTLKRIVEGYLLKQLNLRLLIESEVKSSVDRLVRANLKVDLHV